MDFKFNEATINRPQGSRIIDAAWVFSDLGELVKQLHSESAWEKNDRNGITVFKTDKMSIVLTILKAGTSIKNNVIDGLYMLQVIKGKLHVGTDNCPMELSEGHIINLHKGISHNIIAREETQLLQITFME